MSTMQCRSGKMNQKYKAPPQFMVFVSVTLNFFFSHVWLSKWSNWCINIVFCVVYSYYVSWLYIKRQIYYTSLSPSSFSRKEEQDREGAEGADNGGDEDENRERRDGASGPWNKTGIPTPSGIFVVDIFCL